jgi:hypothetical protein
MSSFTISQRWQGRVVIIEEGHITVSAYRHGSCVMRALHRRRKLYSVRWTGNQP